jgi:hypothetical protein
MISPLRTPHANINANDQSENAPHTKASSNTPLSAEIACSGDTIVSPQIAPEIADVVIRATTNRKKAAVAVMIMHRICRFRACPQRDIGMQRNNAKTSAPPPKARHKVSNRGDTTERTRDFAKSTTMRGSRLGGGSMAMAEHAAEVTLSLKQIPQIQP